MLTEGSFTRDEWDHLIRLLIIMDFAMFSCSHFLSNRKQSVMFKGAQESSKKGSAVAKPRTRESGVKEPPEREERSSARFE